MRATRTSRTAGRRAAVRRGAKRSSKRVAKRVASEAGRQAGSKVAVLVKKQAAVPLEPMLYKLCKAGWAVIVDRTPNAMGTGLFARFARNRIGYPGR